MREELEAALDAGRLFVIMSNGNHWKARRNGKTKTWKTKPDWYVPIKAGLRSYGRIDITWMEGVDYLIK